MGNTGNQYIINYEQMVKKAGELQQLAERYEAEYQGMYRDVETSKAVSDGNEDIKEYYTAIKSFETRFKEMKQLIDQFAETIKGTAKTFEDQKQANITAAKKLANY